MPDVAIIGVITLILYYLPIYSRVRFFWCRQGLRLCVFIYPARAEFCIVVLLLRVRHSSDRLKRLSRSLWHADELVILFWDEPCPRHHKWVVSLWSSFLPFSLQSPTCRQWAGAQFLDMSADVLRTLFQGWPHQSSLQFMILIRLYHLCLTLFVYKQRIILHVDEHLNSTCL